MIFKLHVVIHTAIMYVKGILEFNNIILRILLSGIC